MRILSSDLRKLNVVNGLIGACAVMFILQWLIPGLTQRLLFYPLLGYYQPWRFLSAAFLHGGFFHLLFNLPFLYILGQAAKRFFTQTQFLVIYLLCAWGGSLGTLAWWRLTGNAVATVGASGAVLGMCAAVFVFARQLSDFSNSLGGLLVINLLIGFVLPNVAWHAHLGGVVVGLLVGGAMRMVSVASGRAGRRHLQAVIPDIVDRQKARVAADRVYRLGNGLVVVLAVVVLTLATLACYWTI